MSVVHILHTSSYYVFWIHHVYYDVCTSYDESYYAYKNKYYS